MSVDDLDAARPSRAGRLRLAGFLLAVAAVGSATAATAAVDPTGLSVVAVAPAVSTVAHDLPIEVTAHGPGLGMFCEPFTITVRWSQPHGRPHHESVSSPQTGGAAIQRLMVPSRLLRVGILHYVVTARQTCGLISHRTTSAVRWPARGRSAVDIV
jgi:hypothetical protein